MPKHAIDTPTPPRTKPMVEVLSKAKARELAEAIHRIIVRQKRYRDPSYTARQLARDAGTNQRYVSAVINQEFHTNYNSLINRQRIEEAKKILTRPDAQSMRMHEVSQLVGFANRQSFYTSFNRWVGMSPRAYRLLSRPPQTAADGQETTEHH